LAGARDFDFDRSGDRDRTRPARTVEADLARLVFAAPPTRRLAVLVLGLAPERFGNLVAGNVTVQRGA